MNIPIGPALPSLEEKLRKDSNALRISMEQALATPWPDPGGLAMNESSRCLYPGKWCSFRRDYKSDGSLHNLCVFHRARAIRYQRRLHYKKRLLRAGIDPNEAVVRVPSRRRHDDFAGTQNWRGKQGVISSPVESSRRRLLAPKKNPLASSLEWGTNHVVFHAPMGSPSAMPMLSPDGLDALLDEIRWEEIG